MKIRQIIQRYSDSCSSRRGLPWQHVCLAGDNCANRGLREMDKNKLTGGGCDLVWGCEHFYDVIWSYYWLLLLLHAVAFRRMLISCLNNSAGVLRTDQTGKTRWKQTRMLPTKREQKPVPNLSTETKNNLSRSFHFHFHFPLRRILERCVFF